MASSKRLDRAWHQSKATLQALLAGVALSIPFWSYGFGWLLIPAAAAYVWWLESLWIRNGKLGILKSIGLSGLGFFVLVCTWMYHIHATELIQNNVLAIVFLIVTFAVVAGSLSLGFWLFGWLYVKLDMRLVRRRTLIVLPAAWAVSEYARSFLFSIVSLGPGGSLGPNWNFGSLAFAASVTPLGYGARVVGQFGLSALVMLLACGIVLLFRKQWQLAAAAILTVLLVCGGGWLFSPRANGQTLRVGILQLDDSGYSDHGYQADLSKITSAAHGSRALDLLVLPEYSYLFENPEFSAAEKSTAAKLFANNAKGLIITSRTGAAEQGHKNLVTFYRPDASIATDQEKQFLIPGGEYIPYFYEWILVLSGNTSIIEQHAVVNKVEATTIAARPVTYQDDKVGSLACSGAIAPDFYRRLAAGGATVLTNSAALSTMGLSSGYYAQARQMAAFQAVATARPFIQSARGAQVFALDSNGQQVAASNTAGVHYIEADVQTNNHPTLYNRFGDLVMMVLMVLGVGGVVLYSNRYKIAGN